MSFDEYDLSSLFSENYTFNTNATRDIGIHFYGRLTTYSTYSELKKNMLGSADFELCRIHAFKKGLIVNA